VPTAKRERQKAGRAARQEAIKAAQLRRARQRQIVVFVGIVAVTVAILLVMGVFSGNSSKKTDLKAATKKAAACTIQKQQFPSAPPMTIDATKTYAANVETDAGTFVIDLDAKNSPKTVNNFVFLAKKNFYNCTTFHRVIKDFVAQGGDQEGTGSGGPGYKFDDENLANTKYTIGSVAMANSGPNTNGSQFFVITGTQGASLPPNYNLLGTVKTGMDAVKKIEADGGTQAGGGTGADLAVTHKILKITIKES
jgi:cyclophilin family peptidyl-prolyl cis-trans isomerase